MHLGYFALKIGKKGHFMSLGISLMFHPTLRGMMALFKNLKLKAFVTDHVISDNVVEIHCLLIFTMIPLCDHILPLVVYWWYICGYQGLDTVYWKISHSRVIITPWWDEVTGWAIYFVAKIMWQLCHVLKFVFRNTQNIWIQNLQQTSKWFNVHTLIFHNNWQDYRTINFHLITEIPIWLLH